MIRIVVSAVILYLVLLVVWMPARLISYVPLPPSIQLQNVTGTIWNGQVDMVTVEGLPAYNVHWQLAPLRLLTGHIEVALSTGDIRHSTWVAKGVIGWSFDGIYAQQLTATLPASVVVQQLPIPLPLDVRGRLRLAINEGAQGQPVCEQLAGDLTWQNGYIGNQYIDKPFEFDELSVPLGCDKGSIVANIDEQKLPLALHLNASFDGKQALVDGTVRPQPGLAKQIKQGLPMFAQPTRNGDYRVHLATSL